MMNSRHLPAGQGIPMETGRRRAYNQNQYQNQQYPPQSIYQTYIQSYSASYYSQSMPPPYQNSQPPIPYTQYQSYVRSPPVQQFVAPPRQPLPVPFPRSINPPAVPSIHQAFSPQPQTPLSSRSSQSSTTIAASLVSSTSKRNSSEHEHITRPDLIVTPPFKAPLPWFSRPDLSWPERRTPIKRRPLKNISSGAVKLPINIRNCSIDKSGTKSTGDKIIISETNTSHESEDTLTNLRTPVTAQPQKCHIDTLQVPKTAAKLNNRSTPVVPALPRSINRHALSPSLEKDETENILDNNDISHQACVTDKENPQEIAKIVVQEQESVPQTSAWKTPKLWAGIFHPSASSSNLASSEAVPTTISLESQVKTVTSLAEVLESFSTKSNDSKIAFLEPRGLVNTGNMCYMNSILQVLVFCTLFFDFLDQVSKRAVCSLKSITPLLDAMILFMREYSVINSGISADELRTNLKERDLEQYGDPFIPDFFYNVINRLPRFSSMRRGHQQDAEEFLGFLLEGLHDECVQAIRSMSNEESINALSPSKKPPSLSRTDTAQPFSSVDCTGWLEVGPKQKASVTRSSGLITIETPITKIFGGNLRSELRVPGLKDSVTMEPFQSLLLDIGAPHVNNVVDALRGLTNPEPLHDVFKSPKGPNVKATKQVFIENLPPVLILYLKRFQYDNTGGTQKIWKKISYPLELELPIEVFSRQKRVSFSKNGLPKYRLISAVYHHGKNASGGHYTVDVRRQDGQEWIRLDDTVIKRIKSEDVAEGGSEEDPEAIASNTDQKKKATSVLNTKFDSPEQNTEKDGWKQASGSGKKWPNTVNGNSACKLPSDNFSLKDNKVAYLLFYQKI